MTHGALRWSDAQRTFEIKLGKELIYARAIMKRRNTPVPWVASRVGFSGRDWAGPWFAALHKLSMPGPDFLIFEPKSIESVKTIPASYATVMNFMRMVLCRKCVGFTINEALQYSLHSWRHLYPTMGTQLGLADSLQEVIGHWKKGFENYATNL